jgi:serine/threonine protein kinase
LARAAGTGRWLAPEVLNGGGDYGAACDVYSLGVLLSELDTHDAPYSAFLSADDTPLPEMRLMLLIAAGKIQPSFSDDCPASLHALGLACLSFEPASRPRADDVAARLRALQSELSPRRTLL